MKNKGKLLTYLKVLLSVILISTAVFSIVKRGEECLNLNDPAALAAAAFTLTDGTYKLNLSNNKQSQSKDTEDKKISETEPKNETAIAQVNKKRDKSNRFDLNTPIDVIGISLNIPGDRINDQYAKSVMIDLSRFELTPDVEGDIDEN